MIEEIQILTKSMRDFLTIKMLKIAFIPFILTIIIIYAIFFLMADYGISSLQDVVIASQNNQEVIVDENAPFYFQWSVYIIELVFKYSFASWIALFLLYTIGAILVLELSVVLTLAIIGFLTPTILTIIHKKHYAHLPMEGYGSMISPLWTLVKNLIIMISLFIILTPLYFIPILNILAFSFPFYYFFHKLLNYDVASTILNKDDFKRIYKKERNLFRLRTLFLYLVSHVPFITLFTSVFYVVYLGHAYFNSLEKLNTTE